MCDILYHYCSIEAFTGIISSQSLWLSDVTKSNDEAEINFLWNNYLEYLAKISKSRLAYENMWVDVQLQMENTEFLSISFSEECDSPHMWQTYSNNGVSIGFNREKMYNWIKNIGQYGNTVAVYNNSNETLIQLDKVNYYDKNKIQEKIDQECKGKPKDMFFEYFKKAPFFKTNYWELEKEWRICIPIIINSNYKNTIKECSDIDYIKPKEIKKEFTNYNGICNKAYCAVPFDRDMIESITLSPNCSESIVYIKSVLSANELDSIINLVKRSKFDLSNY